MYLYVGYAGDLIKLPDVGKARREQIECGKRTEYADNVTAEPIICYIRYMVLWQTSWFLVKPKRKSTLSAVAHAFLFDLTTRFSKKGIFKNGLNKASRLNLIGRKWLLFCKDTIWIEKINVFLHWRKPKAHHYLDIWFLILGLYSHSPCRIPTILSRWRYDLDGWLCRVSL